MMRAYPPEMNLPGERKPRSTLRLVWTLLNETIDEFSKDRGDLVAAALAFYTLLSIAPLIIVAVAIAGIFLGQGNARNEVQQLLQSAMGGNAASVVDDWVQQASRSGAIASVIGGVLTLFAASKFTAQLRSALNQIWDIDVDIADGFKASVKSYLVRRLFAFGAVLAAGPLLLTVFASRALLTFLTRTVLPGFFVTGAAAQVTQLVFSLVLVAVMSTIVFRIIPDTHVGWRAAALGAACTSILFNLGNLLVGIYLSKAAVAATYGAAGSAIVLLLWLYFSAEMFLLGAEFTQVYSTHFGRGPDQKQRSDVHAVERHRQ